LLMHWPKNLKNRIKEKEFLKKHTTFRIGGPAQFYARPQNVGELGMLLNAAKKYKIPFRVIGQGSNVLISDSGLVGLTLSLNSPYFKKINFSNNLVEVGAGCALSGLIQKALGRNLGGADFLVGIPGMVGGALAMNAGIAIKAKSKKSKVKSIGDLVESVSVMDHNGVLKNLNKKEIRFGYRDTSLGKYIILSARLKLKKESQAVIAGRIKKYLKLRQTSQDYSYPSAGCVFKNPGGYSAGRLIDLCGLKGERIGDAAVSLKHANFIINLGRAKARDVLKLMDLIKNKVRNKFNIKLESEIKIWK
jgi:UDP-N-acetylmuramate dehydrogenase